MSPEPWKKPTPRARWVKVGDQCQAAKGGMVGTVVRVRDTGSVPYAVVRWPGGSVGRHTITTLRRFEVT